MLKIHARINPTEDPGKVKKAVEKIFPMVSAEVRGDFVVGESEEPEAMLNFGELLREQRIRGAARAFLEHHKEDGKYKFRINKQAALMGMVNFVDFRIALGTIHVETDELLF